MMDKPQKVHYLNPETWVLSLVRAPLRTLIVVMTLVLIASLGALNLKFRGDYNIFFDQGNPQLHAFNAIQAEFAKTDNLAILIAPEDGEIFTAHTLTLLQQLTKDAWQTPYSNRVDSLTNYQHTRAIRGEAGEDDDLEVQDLVPEGMPWSEENLARIRRVALTTPETERAMISKKGDIAVVNITVQLPEKDKTTEIREVYQFVSHLLTTYQQRYPHTRFYKAGWVAMNYALIQSAQDDILHLVPIMFVVILGVLIVLLRSTLSVVATLFVILTAVTATIGLSGWLGLSINVATVNIPTLILTLSVADCVHIISTMKHQMQTGSAKAAAIRQSLKLDFMPVIITSVTTAIGFYMMNMSDSPVLRTFGDLAALGVMIACVLSLTLLPALLHLLPVHIPPVPAHQSSNAMDAVADWIIRYRTVLLPGSIAVILISALLIPSNQINDDSVKYFNPGSEFRQVADFMQQHISGMGTISVVLDSGQDQGIVAPAFLQTAARFTHWLRQQPDVDHVTSLTDTLKRLNQNLHNDNPTDYRLPDNRALTAQYLLMYEMSLPYGLDLNNQLNMNKSSLKIQVTTENLGSHRFIQLEQRINDWFQHQDPQHTIHRVRQSSPSLMFAHIGATNMKSMLISLPLSLLMISALLAIALRSVKQGLFSMMPNMAPAIIGFGLWALISGEINLALSVVASLTLGIVVDDCVHFLSKYQMARHADKSPEDAVRYAFHSVGRALWITTVVLVAGFSVLMLSSFRLNSDMGKLSSLIIFIALLVDFLFLPSLLLFFDRNPHPAKIHHHYRTD